MQLIGQYPIQEAALTPHCGKAVCGMTTDGDCFYGILHRVENGHAYFRPLEASDAQISSLKKAMENAAKVKNTLRLPPQKTVKTSAFWGPYGGRGWAWPLLGLSALFLLPFLFI